MKPVKILLFTWLLCNAFNFLQAQQQEKISQVKVYLPEERTARANMLGFLDVDHFIPCPGGGIICDLTEKNVKKLKTAKVKFEVLVDDVVKKLLATNQKNIDLAKAGKLDLETDRVAYDQSYKTVSQIIQTPAAFKVWGITAPVGPGPNYFGGYYTLTQMYAAIDALVAAYPTIAQKLFIGASLEGRGIFGVKISDNVATDEKATERGALFTGLQHAREAIGGSSLIFLMQYLCEQYAGNTMIKNLVDNREIYIIPCVNVDGYERNLRTNANGGGNQRKNRRKNIIGAGTDDSTEIGVDINRNYQIDWSVCPGTDNISNSCGTSDPYGGTHYGTAVFSEPESQAIRAFVLSRRIHIALDQHSYGPYYSLPFGRPTLHTMSTTDANFFTYIPAVEGMYNGMRAGNSPESVGYEVAGGIKDWLLMGDMGAGSISKGKIYAMTGEGAGGGFWPVNTEIIQLCKGMVFQDIQLLYAAGAYMDVQDTNPLDIPVLSNPKVTAVNFKLTRVGLADSIVKISLIPMENVKYVGPPVTLPVGTMPNYYDTYSGSINATLFNSLIPGMRVRYALKVETGGYVYYDTVTRLYNPLPVMSDNMEGTYATNWTSASWNGATSTALAANNYAFTTGSAFQGTKSMTESPSGLYTSNATRNSTYNGVLNLGPATGVGAITTAYLSFWVRHRAENFRDKMQVQVNSGSGWVAIPGNITVQEPNGVAADGFLLNGQPSLTGIRDLWTKAVFDLTAYKGVTNLQLRFQFTSDGDGGSFTYERDEGFFIDNVQVIKSAAPLVSFTLPVKFVSLRGELLPNNTVSVLWEAVVDQDHDYFEVERSTDGSNFTAIGQVRTGAPYNFIDQNPNIGNNYYRIKQYDKNGDYNYSKVINVVYNTGTKLTIYPNPVAKGEELSIKIEDSRTNAVKIAITDVQGRQVYQQNVTELLGSREIKINTDLWVPGVYVLKLTNTNGELLITQKVIKQ